MVDYTQGGMPNIPIWLQMLGQRAQRPQYGSAAPIQAPQAPASTNNNNNVPTWAYGGNGSAGGGNSSAPLTLNSNGIGFSDPNNPLKKLLGPIGQALGGLFNSSGDSGYSGNAPLQASGSIPGAVGPTSIGGAPLVSPMASVPMPQPRPAMSPNAAATIGSNSYGTPPVQPLDMNGGQPMPVVQPTQAMPPVQGLNTTSAQPNDVSAQAAALGIPPSAIPGSGYNYPTPSPSDILQSILSASAMGAG